MNMIQTIELKKKNLLSYDGKVVFIAEILKENLVTIYNGSGLEKGTTLDCLRPIPLTEELLLKCGFEKCNYGNNKEFISYKMDWFNCRLAVGVLSIMGYNNRHQDIKYLHQLQNLYFALTGKELEITL